jgi:uncharacterized membrane protein (DUF4010 family)
MFLPFLTGFCLALLLGALIGTQREIRLQREHLRDFAGIRTFTLISLLGFLLGFLSNEYLGSYWIVLGSFFILFIFLIFSYYTVTRSYVKQISITSEIVALITFLIGFLVSLGEYYPAIIISISLTTLLFFGSHLHFFAKKLKNEEIYATIKFVIISVVILPLIPNKDYSLLDFPIIGDFLHSQSFVNVSLIAQLNVFNFFNLWLMVVLVSGIGYIGYILMKTIGAKKGIGLIGFFGGFMSSTAVTSTFAIESRKLSYLSIPLIIGTVIACSITFFKILLLVSIFNSALVLPLFLILGLMGFVGLIGAFIYFYNSRLNHVKDFKFESPFTFGPAFKFGFLFLIVMFFSKLVAILLGDKGLYLVAFFSGIVDVDPITFSLAKLADAGTISITTAQISIILAAFANTFFKGFLAYYLGSKTFFKGIGIIFTSIILIGIICLFFL